MAHGQGDIHWFDKLSREDRALMIAYDNHLHGAKTAEASKANAVDILRRRAEALAKKREAG